MNQNDACINMVKQQLRTGDVLDDVILALYEEMPREDFVPPSMRQFAYSDMTIPLAHQQQMLTPLDEGKILQALLLEGHETVLEVGTGTGYFTALLSRSCKKVISIDYYQEFSDNAKINLAKHNCTNVELITADAHNGWIEKAPYDVIIMTGAVEQITETHLLQVLPGGKLVAIIGKAPVMQCVMLSLSHNNEWTSKLLFETYTPPLINKLKVKEFIF
jgi:protein-L-isoaspartate(D-aspartate) O-methyltransferase